MLSNTVGYYNNKEENTQKSNVSSYLNKYHDGKFNKMTNPCFSFVSTGTCIKGDKCYFIHDPRAMLSCTDEEREIIYSTMWCHIQHHNYQCQLKAQELEDPSENGDTDGESVSSDDDNRQNAKSFSRGSIQNSKICSLKENVQKISHISDSSDSGHWQSGNKKVQEAGFYFPRQLHRGREAVGNRYFYTLKSKLESNDHALLVESLWMHFLSNFSPYGTIDTVTFQDESYALNLVTQKSRLPIFQSLSQS